MYIMLSISIVISAAVFSAVKTTAHQDECQFFNNCSACITSESCVWCSIEENAYCTPQDQAHLCSLVQNPRSSILEEEKLEIDSDSQHQVSLESIHLILRVGDPVTFNLSVKAAANFPLDLYILMDLSKTFEHHLETVKGIAPLLANSLDNLTSDHKIGFGVFVDKETFPYINTLYPYSKASVEPFSFEHVATLTNSSTAFSQALQDVNISTNVDAPEGTLDAIMQAIVCKDVIGWREKSRKVLMIMTDDTMHTAGDGSLAGIVQINDGKCYTFLDSKFGTFRYNASTSFDYPSLEQIRQTLSDNDVIAVFAVPNTKTDYFNMIAKITDSFVSILTDKAKNIISSVETAYNQIVSLVSVELITSYSFLQTSVTLMCPDGSIILETEDGRQMCDNVSNSTVNISITMELKQCIEEFNDIEIPVNVRIPGFDSFTVFIEGICSCDCDSKEEEATNATRCVNGILTCDKCNCNEGWKGKNCECESSITCKETNGEICSGNGVCEECGCACDSPESPQYNIINPIIFGDACECTNYKCTRAIGNDLVCNGNGTCACSNGIHECQCGLSKISNTKYFGEACECSADHCINPSDQQSGFCSGHGTCTVSEAESICPRQGEACTCHTGFSGNYCQVSQAFGIFCNHPVMKDCFDECLGRISDEHAVCSEDCSNFVLTPADNMHDDYQINGTIPNTTIQCTKQIGNCEYEYLMGISASPSSNTHFLYSVRYKACPDLEAWQYVLIILGCLIIVGIVIIILIKLCLVYCDYREYKKFEKEVKQAHFSEYTNPMYQTPEVTYTNIAYGRRDSFKVPEKH